MEPSNSGIIDVCVITDAAYVVPTAVMLTSLKLNKFRNTHYRIHCLCSDVPEHLTARLSELIAPDFEICIKPVALDAVPIASGWGHISPAAMLRFKIAEFLPNLEKVLYLDGDTIVRADLGDLYSTPIGDYYAAAVADMSSKPHIIDRGNAVPIREHFNSGVMLFNLDAMRRENLGEQCIRAFSANPDWFLDQETFNFVFNGKIRILPLRYNAVSIMLNWRRLDCINERYGTTYTSWNELENDIAVLHIAGPEKPWKQLNAPYSDIWLHYYNLSPVANSLLTRDVALSPAFAYAIRFCLYQWALRIIDKLPLLSVRKQKDTTRICLLRGIPLMHIEETDKERNFRLFGVFPPVRTKK